MESLGGEVGFGVDTLGTVEFELVRALGGGLQVAGTLLDHAVLALQGHLHVLAFGLFLRQEAFVVLTLLLEVLEVHLFVVDLELGDLLRTGFDDVVVLTRMRDGGYLMPCLICRM